MPPSSTRRGCSACPWPRSPTLPECLLAISGGGGGTPSTGWWPDVGPRELEPNRPGTSRADPSGSPAGARRARLSGPWARADTPESQSRTEGGSTNLPDEGDTVQMDNQLLLSVEEAADVLRLGRTRISELVMTKRIQSVNAGRRRLVVRTSLLDFVQTLLLEQECA